MLWFLDNLSAPQSPAWVIWTSASWGWIARLTVSGMTFPHSDPRKMLYSTVLSIGIDLGLDLDRAAEQGIDSEPE